MKIAAPFMLYKQSRQRRNKTTHRFNLYVNAGPAGKIAYIGLMFLGSWSSVVYSHFRPKPFVFGHRGE